MKTYLTGRDKDFLEGIKALLDDIVDVTIFVGKEVSPEQLAENAADAEILVASPSAFEYLSEEHLKGMPNLKFITTVSVGTDWIDLEAARSLGITVSNEKGVNAEAVAQHCFGMVLDLSKRITEADRGLREKGEQRAGLYTGTELYGKTLGVLGLGDIGKKIARIATGFDMRVLGTNKSGTTVEGVELADLDTVLTESDVIAVSVTLTPETESMVSTRELEMMKDGAILVSIAREKVIDREALLKILDTDKLRGFAYDAEIAVPMAADDPFLVKERVIITPHTASVSEEAIKGYATMTVENIKAFLGGEAVRVVN